MPRKYKIVLIVCALFLFGLGIVSSPAQAAPEFSVVPVDGGNTIRFSRGDLKIGVTKEVRVRITGNDNVRYQVFQQLAAPFTNERGVTITRPDPS